MFRNMIQRFLPSSALFTYPSGLKGSARLFDFFGTLDEYNYKETDEEADGESIFRDWSLVGNDIKTALEHYGQNSSAGGLIT